MKFKLDENLPESLVPALVALGHDVVWCVWKDWSDAPMPTFGRQPSR